MKFSNKISQQREEMTMNNTLEYISKVQKEFFVARNAFQDAASEFAENILIKIRKELPEILGVPAGLVFPKIMREIENPHMTGIMLDSGDSSNPYNADMVVSTRLSTVARFLIDGKKSEKVEYYVKLLNKYMPKDNGKFESLDDIRNDLKRLAFCLGMDNRSINGRAEDKQFETASKYCPEYPEEFRNGKNAYADEINEQRRFPTQRRKNLPIDGHEYLCVRLLVEEDAGIVVMAALAPSPMDIQWQISIQGNPAMRTSDFADKILQEIQPVLKDEQENTPGMGM